MFVFCQVRHDTGLYSSPARSGDACHRWPTSEAVSSTASEAPTLHRACGKIAAGSSTLAEQLARQPSTVLVSEVYWLTRFSGRACRLFSMFRTSFAGFACGSAMPTARTILPRATPSTTRSQAPSRRLPKMRDSTGLPADPTRRLLPARVVEDRRSGRDQTELGLTNGQSLTGECPSGRTWRRCVPSARGASAPGGQRTQSGTARTAEILHRGCRRGRS
jgi:hypothetical protein